MHDVGGRAICVYRCECVCIHCARPCPWAQTQVVADSSAFIDRDRTIVIAAVQVGAVDPSAESALAVVDRQYMAIAREIDQGPDEELLVRVLDGLRAKGTPEKPWATEGTGSC